MNCNWPGRKSSWPNISYCLQDMSKTTKNLSQDSLFPDGDWNRAPHQYHPEAFPLEATAQYLQHHNISSWTSVPLCTLIPCLGANVVLPLERPLFPPLRSSDEVKLKAKVQRSLSPFVTDICLHVKLKSSYGDQHSIAEKRLSRFQLLRDVNSKIQEYNFFFRHHVRCINLDIFSRNYALRNSRNADCQFNPN